MKALVTKIIDGDTFDAITILRNRRVTVRVRIAGYDAPEMGTLAGLQAKMWPAEKILHKVVTLNPKTVDVYGRLVADISLN